MKKILLVFAILMTMCLNASAQSDGFITNDGGYSNRDGGSAEMPRLPQGGVGSLNSDQSAPLGSGLLIFSMLGGAYLLRKKTSNL